jgi:peptide/nickel transport system ATP-binding protein
LISDSVAVMYLGEIVEYGAGERLFDAPRHPYTKALIESVPLFHQERAPAPLSGDPPDPRRPPAGCRFHTRCPVGPTFNPERLICIQENPHHLLDKGGVACHFA